MTGVGLRSLAAEDLAELLEVAQRLSYARALDGVIDVVKRSARKLLASDGVTFVLRDVDRCYYVDEEAIAPLWKGGRFPMNSCISGWAMIHRESVVIEDIYADARIPHDLYRQTFVKSLVMAPIRQADPLGAIGAYWAARRRPSPREVGLLESIAAATCTAIANAELNRQLEDAIKLREQFIIVAAHELKTPLTPLRLKVDGLGRMLEGAQPAEVRGRLDQISGALVRVEETVAGLVDQIRMWSDRLAIEPEELDLSRLVAAVVERHRARAEQQRTTLTFASGGPILGAWDAARVDQAVAALIDNAVKFSAESSVAVSVEADERQARVRVVDRGAGIKKEDQRRIFERFARGVDTRQFGGFGLGLWTAQQIAAAHRGELRLEASAPGEGSTFSLSLPRA
jgi:signal transduction histidine kinase